MEKGGDVKKLVVLVTLCLSMCASGMSVVDVQFSPVAGGHPGSWHYDGDLTLSFSQVVGIDLIEGEATDALCGQQVYIPDLVFVDDGTYKAVIPNDSIRIKDASGNLLLLGTLADGEFVSIGTTGVIYAERENDITVTGIYNTINSDFLDSILVGAVLDFNLTLQSNEYFSNIWGDGNGHGNGFSGSIDIINPIPEPTTIALLGLGSLALVRVRKRA